MVLTASTMVQLGTPMPDFRLPDTTGRMVERDDFAGKPLLVAFICNHCPYVKHIADVWSKVAASLQQKGVAVVAINSNDVENYPDDAPDKMVAEVGRRGYTFPYLYDESQEVARRFRAACTPDFFLYDAGGHLAYRGQFDDARPGNGAKVTGGDLVAAADDVLAGRTPTKQVPSVGCNIKWR